METKINNINQDFTRLYRYIDKLEKKIIILEKKLENFENIQILKMDCPKTDIYILNLLKNCFPKKNILSKL